MASLNHGAARFPAALLALSLIAACGGDRTGGAGGTDTTGTAAMLPESTAMPATGTTSPATSDSGSSGTARDTAPISASAPPANKPVARTAPAPASATRPASPTDTGAKRPAPTPAAGRQMAAAEARTAHDSAMKPTRQAQRDTARVEQAESPRSAAVPAPAPTPGQQDTAKATTGSSDAPLRDVYHQAPRDTVSQAVYDGWKQYNLNCARCHGEDVAGTTIAPHLIVSLKPTGPVNSKESFVQTVCAGRPEKGMPAWCSLGLEMEKINSIYEYVKGRSDAKVGPGRPAVRQQG